MTKMDAPLKSPSPALGMIHQSHTSKVTWRSYRQMDTSEGLSSLAFIAVSITLEMQLVSPVSFRNSLRLVNLSISCVYGASLQKGVLYPQPFTYETDNEEHFNQSVPSVALGRFTSKDILLPFSNANWTYLSVS